MHIRIWNTRHLFSATAIKGDIDLGNGCCITSHRNCIVAFKVACFALSLHSLTASMTEDISPFSLQQIASSTWFRVGHLGWHKWTGLKKFSLLSDHRLGQSAGLDADGTLEIHMSEKGSRLSLPSRAAVVSTCQRWLILWSCNLGPHSCQQKKKVYCLAAGFPLGKVQTRRRIIHPSRWHVLFHRFVVGQVHSTPSITFTSLGSRGFPDEQSNPKRPSVTLAVPSEDCSRPWRHMMG